MSLTGIDEAIFASTDLGTCRRFFLDWGLTLLAEDAQTLRFETLNGARVTVAHSDSTGLAPGDEPDPTLREIVWGEASQADLDALRPMLRPQVISMSRLRLTCMRSARPAGSVQPMRSGVST